MRALAILVFTIFCNSMTVGSLYNYPPDKRPSLSLKEACGIGEKLLGTLGLERDFYILDVSIWGDEKGSGAGNWHLRWRNAEGDEISMCIYFPDDLCAVTPEPKAQNSKLNNFKPKAYTRDGKISQKWLEMQTEIEQRRMEWERIRSDRRAAVQSLIQGSGSKESSKETEQPGSAQPDTNPADKVSSKIQPSPPTSKDAPR